MPGWTCLPYFIAVLSKKKKNKNEQLNANTNGGKSLVEAYAFEQMLVETVSRDSLGSARLESAHQMVETAPNKTPLLSVRLGSYSQRQ